MVVRCYNNLGSGTIAPGLRYIASILKSFFIGLLRVVFYINIGVSWSRSFTKRLQVEILVARFFLTFFNFLQPCFFCNNTYTPTYIHSIHKMYDVHDMYVMFVV